MDGPEELAAVEAPHHGVEVVVAVGVEAVAPH